MKKIIGISAALLLLASTSFAATFAPDANLAGLTLHGDGTTASATTAVIGKLSKNVVLTMNYSTSGYSLFTFYNFSPWKQGESKAFGTSQDSSAIFYQVPNAAPTAAPTNADLSEFTAANGWTSM
jgi:hypothetical protein